MTNVSPLQDPGNGVIELVTVSTHVCLPGEPVLLAVDGAVLSLGSGITRRGQGTHDGLTGEIFVSAFCGTMVREKSAAPGAPVKYSVVPSTQKRYIPRKGDPVVGTILRANAHNYHVSIGAAHPATLEVTAFDGATKMSRPRLRAGDVFYGHVLQCDPGLDVDVSCCAFGTLVAKDWTTGEGLFGPLQRGTVITVPIGYARELFENKVSVLALIGQRVAYEVCIGLNGKIWLRAQGKGGAAGVGDGGLMMEDSEHTVTIAVAECILESQGDASDDAAVTQRVESFFPYSLH